MNVKEGKKQLKYGARDREGTGLQVRKQDTKLEKFLAIILRKYALSSLHVMGSFLEKLTFCFVVSSSLRITVSRLSFQLQ
jgi:hypothetical protein